MKGKSEEEGVLYRVAHESPTPRYSFSMDIRYILSYRRMEYRVLHMGVQSLLSTDTISPTGGWSTGFCMEKIQSQDPRSGMNIQDPGSGLNIPDLIFEILVSVIALKIIKIFYADPDPGIRIFLSSSDPGFGMEKMGYGILDPG